MPGRSVGRLLRTGFEELQSRYDIIGHVRGRGLFFGIELSRDGKPATPETKRIVNDLARAGLLVSKVGHHDNVLKIRPPMVFRSEHVTILFEILDGVLARFGKH